MENRIKLVRTIFSIANPSKNLIKIDLSTESKIAKTYKDFRAICRWCSNAPLQKLAMKLITNTFNTPQSFVDFFTDWRVIEALSKESYDRKSFKIVLPKEIDNTNKLKAAVKYFEGVKLSNPNFDNTVHCFTEANFEEDYNRFVEGLSNPEDNNKYYFCRHADGGFNAMAIMCGSYDADGNPVWDNISERCHVRALYRKFTNNTVNYFNARECSGEYWLNHDELRFATR